VANSCQPDCVVGGAVYQSGNYEPDAGCNVCTPATSTVNFTPLTGLSPFAGACPSKQDVCDTGVCTLGCFISDAFEAPGTDGPDAGAGLDCCVPAITISNWTPQWSQSPYGVGTGAQMLVGANLAGVPGLSLIAGNVTSNSVTVLPNKGGGLYGPAVSYLLDAGIFYQGAVDGYSHGATLSLGVGAGDLTGDGIPDLITYAGGIPGTLTVFPGQDGGSFAAPTSTEFFSPLDAGEYLIGVSAHFFPSGAAGAVLTVQYGGINPHYGPLDIIGQPAGGGVPAVVSSLPVAFNYGNAFFGQQAVVADLNGDGLDDLAATSDYATSCVSILLNDGSGGLGGEADDVCGQKQGLAAAPFFLNTYGSGAPALDLVTFDKTAQQLIALENNGSGSFTQAGAGVPLSTNDVDSLAAGDFNGDGYPDVAALYGGSYTVQIFFGDGSGDFSVGPSFTTNEPSTDQVWGQFMLGGPFGANGVDAFFGITASSTVTLWQDVCR
jgi:hypothetical protein